MTVSTCWPFLKKRMLGMERTLNRMAVRWFASTSSLVTLALPMYSPASWSRIGATTWHGPHHDAQKSTSTSPFACSISAANEASLTCTVKVFVAPMLVILLLCYAGRSPRPAGNRPNLLGGPVADLPRIAHVGIAVADLETALAFYRDVLGILPRPPETV